MLGVSYNLPKFCPNATWDPNAITLADSTAVGSNPHGIFVDINNTVYVAARNLGLIQVWFAGNNNPNKSIAGSWTDSTSLFTNTLGDIYFDNGNANHRVDKWAMSTGVIGQVMNVDDPCRGLFIDLNNTLYCSIKTYHLVKAMSLIGGMSTPSVVAGSGSTGSTMADLNNPEGIFVDFGFNLYVADRMNHRIQLFGFGNLTARTVAGNGATGTISLNEPAGVFLDGGGYLFIADRKNHRIIGSGPNGYRCVAGCFGGGGSSADQLNQVQTLSFDSFGNMFVTDIYNSRVQKFLLSMNSCSK